MSITGQSLSLTALRCEHLIIAQPRFTPAQRMSPKRVNRRKKNKKTGQSSIFMLYFYKPQYTMYTGHGIEVHMCQET